MKLSRFIMTTAMCLSASLSAAPLDFAKDILPILERSCLPCHNETKAEAELKLETPQLMIKGGENGPVIKPNHASESLLYLTSAKLKKPFMPPAENKSKALPLTSQQIELIRRWIDEGAVGHGKARSAPKWESMPGVGRIGAVAVANDGSVVAAARGNRVALYDALQLQPMAELPVDAHRDVVTALAFSPDGDVLATGSYGEVKLWKRETMRVAASKLPLKLEQPLEARSADGAFVVSAPANAVARVASANGKTTVGELRVDRALALRLQEAERLKQATTFEFTYQTSEKTKAEDALKKFQEDDKTASAAHADFVKRKAAIDKAVADGEKKRQDTMKAREEATAANDRALKAKEEAEAAETKANDALKTAEGAKDEAKIKIAKAAAELAKKSKEAAVKAQAEADKQLKDAVTKFNDAVKVLSEAKSEVGKAIDAERTAKKSAEDVAQSKTALAAVLKQLDAAKAAQQSAEKAFNELKGKLPQVPSVFRGVALAPGEKWIVSSHDDGVLRGWSLNGTALWSLVIDKAPLGPVTFVDGELRVAKASGETMSVDLTARWSLIRTMGDSTKADSVLTDRVNALAFSPDGKVLATGSGDPSRSGQIQLWDIASGKRVHEFTKAHKDTVLALDFSADGKQLASGSADRAVRVWDVANGKLMRNLEAHSNHVLAVSFRRDGRMLASAGADNAVRTWTMSTGDVVKTISDFKKEVTGVRYVENRNLLLASSGDPSLRTFMDEGSAVRAETKGFNAYITTSAATSDGKLVVAGDASGRLRLVDGEGKLLAEW